MDEGSKSHGCNKSTDRGSWPGVVAHIGVGVLVAINVEDGQNVKIHLGEQAGHLRVAAEGVQSLSGVGKGVINSRKPVTLLHDSPSPL